MLWSFVPTLLLCACSQKAADPAPPSRPPVGQEMSAESVVVNYAPRRLRVFPDRATLAKGQGPGRLRYVIIASERPELPATWRPLGVSDRQPPADFRPRAGPFVWIADHVLTSAVAMEDRSPGPPLLVFDHDGKPAGRPALALPVPCTVTEPALLQSGPAGRTGAEDPAQVYGLLRCASEDRGILLTLDAAGTASRVLAVAGAGAIEVFLHDDDADYLLAGRRVLRVDRDGRQTIGTVPPPGGGAETRALMLFQGELLVIDGAAGRVIRMDPHVMSWHGEARFPVGPKVERLRAVGSGDHLLVVVSEQVGTGAELFGIAVRPAGPAADGARLFLGSGPSPSDHELVPVDAAEGGGAILVRTHRGNSGPLVGLTRLRF